MAYNVRFMPQAAADLRAIYDYIAPRGGDAVARDFVARLHGYCLGLDVFPERGALRDDIRPALRLLGYRRQATIAFTVDESDVFILRILRRGLDVEAVLRDEDGAGDV
jgi:toxin ParE1/3/4